MSFDLSWLDALPVSTVTLKRRGGAEKGVVVLNSKTSVVDALNCLVREEILSAPVWDDEKNDFVATLVCTICSWKEGRKERKEGKEGLRFLLV
jgi:hypothetical protein